MSVCMKHNSDLCFQVNVHRVFKLTRDLIAISNGNYY